MANRCDATKNCSDAGTLGVLLGNGDGTFQTAVSYNSGGQYAQAVAVADVNGDGKLDALVANQCLSFGQCQQNNSTVGVLLGNGDGTLQPAVAYSTGGQPAYSVAAGDVNGDGKLDLVVANQCETPLSCANGGVGVLLGIGDGTFTAPVTYASSGNTANWVAIGDVDGDGKPDLVVVNYCVDATNCASGSLDLMLGNGDGTFQASLPYGTGGAQSFVAALGDIDSDGRLDIVVANQCVDSNCDDGSVGVLVNPAFGVSGTAFTPTSVSPGGTASATIMLAPSEGYSGTVNLTCTVSGGGSPAPTCALNPASISGASTTSTLTVTTIGASRASMDTRKSFYGLWLPVGGMSLLGLCLTRGGRARKFSRATVSVASLILLMLFSGCGNSGGNAGGGGGGGCSGCTAAGSYSITVMGIDSANRKITQTVSPALTLTVN